jgi:hypothetical protein
MLQAAGAPLEVEFVIFNSIAGGRLLGNARPVRNQTFDSAQKRTAIRRAARADWQAERLMLLPRSSQLAHIIVMERIVMKCQ